ncbi:Ger(x)C family spore germination protein [Effusibacillus pohliae]|uniref:Ger(x)C family spore germination protein n=1 Tax=Effusibacillus pohliae TaxID=232270 RepID=UPI00037712B4|nr:Ger(x)C family spore germination protein [Effusibacillus pohliae]
MNRLRRLLSLLLVSVLAGSVTGCYDRVELEGLAFVVSLGLDKGPDNTIDVTARIAVPRKSADGSGGGGGGGKEEAAGGEKPVTVRAHSLPEALNLLNTTVERRISLIHLANLVIGDSLAREGVIEYLRPLTRLREFRRTITIFIVQGNVRQAYESNKPILEQSITRLTESLDDVGRHTGLTANKKLHEFVVSMEAPNEDAFAPTIAINRYQEDRSDREFGSREQGAQTNLSFRPGEVVRQGGNPLDFVGTAIFRNDRLVTTLDGIDTRMLLTVRGELLRTQMDFSDPLVQDKYVSVELKHARSPVVDVDLHANPMRIKIRERLEGDLIGTQSHIDYTRPENLLILERSIRERLQTRQEAMINRVFREHQADPFGIFKRIRGQFATLPEMRAFDYRNRLRDAVVNVEVDLQLRRIGTQLAPFNSR